MYALPRTLNAKTNNARSFDYSAPFSGEIRLNHSASSTRALAPAPTAANTIAGDRPWKMQIRD